MFRTRVAKALLIPAMVVPTTVGTLAFASASGAAVKPASATAKCTVLSGNYQSTANLSNCNNTTVTGGSGSFPADGLSETSGTVTLTWANDLTSVINYNATLETNPACGKGKKYIYVILKGNVADGGTNTGIPVGDKVSADICFNSKNGNLALLTGKKFKV